MPQKQEHQMSERDEKATSVVSQGRGGERRENRKEKAFGMSQCLL